MIFSRHVGAFVSKQQKNLHFLQKELAKASEMPIIRPTQRRAVVTIKKKTGASFFFAL